MRTVETRPALLLYDFLPNWDVREQHSRRIGASPGQVRTALLQITARHLPFGSLMLALRFVPAVMARTWPFGFDRSVMELFVDLGFVELANTEHEIVLGTVGRFWRFREELRALSSPDDFNRFEEPGFAKGAINFRVEDEGGAALLSTETRVEATDDRARRLFEPYWIPVRAVGGLMRSEMLRAVERRATGEGATAA